MSRLRAETMPAVTEPPRLNGLPMATTHSPSRSLSDTELHCLERFVALDAQEREIDLLVGAYQFGLEAGAIVENDGDLVAVGYHVIVGNHHAGWIDDEAAFMGERQQLDRRLA